MFGRRAQPSPPRRARGVIAEIVGEDHERVLAERAARRRADLAALRAIVDEAVIRQDQAEELLAEISAREPLAPLARRGGDLVSRLLALKRSLPEPADAALRAYARAVGEVLDHHVMMVSSSLDALAVDWRSERVVAMLDRLDGLGAPAERLDALRLELALLEPADDV